MSRGLWEIFLSVWQFVSGWAGTNFYRWTWVAIALYLLTLLAIVLLQSMPYTRKGYLVEFESEIDNDEKANPEKYVRVAIKSRTNVIVTDFTAYLLSVKNQRTNETVWDKEVQLTWSGENPPETSDHRCTLSYGRPLFLDIAKTRRSDNIFLFTTFLEDKFRLGAGIYQFNFVVRGQENGVSIREFIFQGLLEYKNGADLKIVSGSFIGERIWFMGRKKKKNQSSVNSS
jgi:hypothetical protein